MTSQNTSDKKFPWQIDGSTQLELDAEGLRSLVDRSADLFENYGALVIDNCFDRELIDSLRIAFFENYCLPDNGGWDVRKIGKQVGDRRFQIAMDICDPFNNPAVYANQITSAIFQKVLGANNILNSFGAVVSLPGAAPQHVHRDHPMLFDSLDVSTMIPTYAITMVIPLINIDMNTGTTAIWEGSHRIAQPFRQIERSYSASCPTMKAGACYLMDYRLVHGGSANLTSSPRPILYSVYSRPWFVDFVNFESYAPISISDAELAKVPFEHRPLFLKAVQMKQSYSPRLAEGKFSAKLLQRRS